MTTATKDRIENLDQFYAHVEQHGKLRTADHAKRWTAGTLQMMGTNLGRGSKGALNDALPEELQRELTRILGIAIVFRNTNIEAREFCNRVARRSRGTSDADFAKYPVAAVFGALKRMVSSSVADKVREDLSPELTDMWDNA